MWRHHPDNATPAAWKDALDTLTQAERAAHGTGVALGIEPEPGNVVSDARKAVSMLAALDSDTFGIIFDPANLIGGLPHDKIAQVIDESLDQLGHRIVSAHGKDRNSRGNVAPAGQGIVPWGRVVAGLRDAGYCGSVMLHGLNERDVATAVAYLRHHLTLQA
jgi:sugar phosphate isomerase/epimerase